MTHIIRDNAGKRIKKNLIFFHLKTLDILLSLFQVPTLYNGMSLVVGFPKPSSFLVSELQVMHCKYVQWNYSVDTTKKCKTDLQFFYCNMDKYFAVHNTVQKCKFKFTVIMLHLEQQSNVKNTVKNCKIYCSYSTVLCTFLSCVPYLQCRLNAAYFFKQKKQ